MLPRVLFVWLPFSVLVLLLGLYSQGEEFEFQHLPLALWLSSPVGLAVLRDGLGDAESKQLQYPSITLMVVSAWILAVAPSLVVESEAARFVYHYSPIALTLARVFFFCWCLSFTYACGKPRIREFHAQATLPDFLACVTIAGVVAAYMMRAGIFSSYQGGKGITRMAEAGSTESLALSVGMPLFTLLPPLFFLALLNARRKLSHYLLVFAGFLSSWGLLFLLGSRTSLASGVACILVLCRGLGMRLRANVLIGLGVGMPALLVLVLVYRTQLAANETEATNVAQFISVATDATTSLNEKQAQDNALDLVSHNARARLWYGQQFCVLVDQWLDEGAAMRGSLFSGTIASLPTQIYKHKNESATELNFERILIESQRFPDIDLAPMPWMQWLYELGLVGLIIGTFFYSWFVRLIESRLSKTRSFYETLFWLHMFASIVPPEHTTDWLVLTARNIFVIILMLLILSKVLTWFSHLGRRDIKLALR